MDSATSVPTSPLDAKREATLLSMYLEGIALTQIARAFQVTVQDVVRLTQSDEALWHIEMYERAIWRQARFLGLAARVPAIAALSDVCSSDAPPAERRRSASDLLHQTRPAKPTKSREPARSPKHNFATDEFINALEPLHDEPLSEEPLAEGLLSEELLPEHPLAEEPLPEDPLTEDPLAEELLAADPLTEHPLDRARSPEAAEFEPTEPSQLQPAPIDQDPITVHSSRAHTATWHAFEDDETRPQSREPATAQSTPSPSTTPRLQTNPQQSDTPTEPPTRAPSPFDTICPAQISTPLPDAVPVAA